MRKKDDYFTFNRYVLPCHLNSNNRSSNDNENGDEIMYLARARVSYDSLFINLFKIQTGNFFGRRKLCFGIKVSGNEREFILVRDTRGFGEKVVFYQKEREKGK